MDYPAWAPAPDVWAVSDVNVDVLRATCPKLAVTKIPLAIDTRLFWFTEERRREASGAPRWTPLVGSRSAAAVGLDERAVEHPF